MHEEYINLDMQVLLANDSLARRIIHRLQSGQNIDSQLIGEYRFLESHYDTWSSFFDFLGYRLQRSAQGGEVFYHLAANSTRIKVTSLRRGATFLGLFLAWHFMSAGIEGKDEVQARELISRLENSFEFNQLIRVFNPQQNRAIRAKQQSARKMQQLTGWVLTSLRDLHRLRFIELYPSVNADFDKLRILRLPALIRFLEPARRSLDMAYAGNEDLDAAIQSIWSSLDWEDDNEDNGPEDT
ncbi:MAG: hypothetical protein U5L00_02750 [Desulfovermiculus sp.]|nr:hypothetical protein [Desulfovermiculus sp.]